MITEKKMLSEVTEQFTCGRIACNVASIAQSHHKVRAVPKVFFRDTVIPNGCWIFSLQPL